MDLKQFASLLIFALGLGACAGAERTLHGIVGGENPLVGKIWSVREKRFVSQTELLTDLQDAEYTILGEIHDNSDHHVLQAEVLRGIVRVGKSPVVAFENQDEKLYAPIHEVIAESNLPMAYVNLSTEETRLVRARGLEGMDDKIFRELEMQKGFSSGVTAMLGEEIRAGHCYKLPDSLVPQFITVQHARDAVMAYRTREAAKEKRGAVVITGSAHARKEWGIPHYFRRMDGKIKVRTISFTETKPDFVKPEVYLENEFPYDYLWFTPTAKRENPCAENEKALDDIGAKNSVVKEKPKAKPAPKPKTNSGIPSHMPSKLPSAVKAPPVTESNP